MIKIVETKDSAEAMQKGLTENKRKFIILEDHSLSDIKDQNGAPIESVEIGDIVTDIANDPGLVYVITHNTVKEAPAQVALRSALVQLKAYCVDKKINDILIPSVFVTAIRCNITYIKCLLKELCYSTNLNFIICIPESIPKAVDVVDKVMSVGQLAIETTKAYKSLLKDDGKKKKKKSKDKDKKKKNGKKKKNK